jgi:O-antigen/teichoic acid export membrane protein
MNTSGRVIKNTIYLYIKSIVSMVVMLFVTRIVLQALGVVDYGIYNVVAGAIAILGFFRNSLAVTMQRYLNHYQGEENFEKQKQVFNIGIVFHWIVALALVLFFVVLGYILFNSILNIPEDRIYAAKIVYVCLIVNTFLTVIIAPYDATITAHENMLFFSLVGIFESFLKLAVALIIAYTSGDKLILYALLMMVVPLLETTAMRIYCKVKYAECVFSPKGEWNGPLAKDMMKFAGWSLVGASTNVVSNHGANLALNHFFGAAINAVVGIANQIQGVLAVLLNGMLKSLTPVIFKKEGAGNMNHMLRISMLGCKYSALLFSFLAVPVFIYTPQLLHIWLIDVPEWTVLFVRLQLLRAFIEQLGASMMNALNATNHIKELNVLSCIYNLLPIAILSVLYSLGFPPYWHYIIMILIMVMGQLITNLMLCEVYCGLKIREFLYKVVLPCITISFASFSFGNISYLIDNDIIGFIACFFLCSFAFVLFFPLFSSEKEREMFVKLWNQLLNKWF